jgi:hypothetical protein
MNFKFWLNESEDLIRPNASGFQRMQDALTSLGFQKTDDLGIYFKKTNYGGEIYIMGDRKQQYSNQSLSPSSNSEYWRIFIKVLSQNLDERSRQAISKFAGNKPGLVEPISNFEKLKIRSNFVPKRESENGPEISFEKGSNIVFQWYVREPKFVFSILDHILESPPTYIGNIDDDNNDGEEKSSPFSPQPGNLLTV